MANRLNRTVDRSRPELDIMRSPLNARPQKRDIVDDGDIPPGMSPRDPLGHFPKGTLTTGKGRGRR